MIFERFWTRLTGNHTDPGPRVSRNRRNPGQYVGVLYCDAGQLKSINNTYGHNVANVVRSTLATRVRSCVREEDTVGRIGTDKIWVELRGVHNVEDVLAVADKIQRSVTEPINYHIHTIHPTVQIGATLALPGESVADTTNRADTAMSGSNEFRASCVKAV